MTELKSPVFLVVILGLSLFELVRRKQSGLTYDLKAGAASIGVAAGQFLTTALNGGVMTGVSIWAYQLAPWHIDMTLWWAWPAAFLMVEFAYYWFHRLSHETRWLWATHAVHHTPNEMTFLAAIRLGWTGLLSGAPFFYLPAIMLGFHPAVVYGILVVNLRFQFFLHTELVGKLGVLDLVFNSPSNHRVHHGSNSVYLDRNYGGMTMIFDHLFGTYQKELEDEPVRYGLVEPIISNNPIVIALHQWPILLVDIGTTKGLWNKLKVAFGYPGRDIVPPLLNATANRETAHIAKT
jgi:sterol desaturase/sphingolipid hydroxylase (fatty acid hydroxylase superfamily)